MKHVNELGQIESEALKALLWRLEGQVTAFLDEWSVSPLECQVIAKHLSSSVSFAATSCAVRAHFGILNGENK
jgi:hypothetical protein